MNKFKKQTIYTIWFEKDMCEEKRQTKITLKKEDEAKKACEHLNKKYEYLQYKFWYEKEEKIIFRTAKKLMPIEENSQIIYEK